MENWRGAMGRVDSAGSQFWDHWRRQTVAPFSVLPALSCHLSEKSRDPALVIKSGRAYLSLAFLTDRY